MNQFAASRTWSLLLAFAVVGCSDKNLPGKPDYRERPIPADQIADFAELYKTNCAACHGAEGRLGPAPPLNDPLFLAIVTERDLWRTLIEGRHGTAMASFAANPKAPGTDPARVPTIASTPFALTPRQIIILAERIKKKWPADEKTIEQSRNNSNAFVTILLQNQPLAAAASSSYFLTAPNVPPYRAEGVKGSVSKGKEAFKRACAVCHGKDGKAAGLEINEPNFLALISVQALRRIIITGRPDLGMPSYRDERSPGDKFKPLTNQEIDDLQALLVSWKQGSDEGK